jgi:pimeloyl-ACP methyl ester carboxylesterase
MRVVLPLPKLRVAGRELAAFARQAWLLRHDVGEPVLPSEVAAGDHVVVCLHGLFATAGVLRPMRQRLERRTGVHTATLSYPVGPGIEALMRRLGVLLDELPANAHLHLVGHSVGGVVARYYAQHAGDARVLQTISLAAPFAGVRQASRLGVAIARDLDPASQLLRSLRLGSTRAFSLPHLSIVAEDDRLVGAPLSHVLPGGDVTVIRECGHNSLLYHNEVARLVERRILDEIAALP